MNNPMRICNKGQRIQLFAQSFVFRIDWPCCRSALNPVQAEDFVRTLSDARHGLFQHKVNPR